MHEMMTPHPGKVLRQCIEQRGWTQGDLAVVLGVPRGGINRIINGKCGISPTMARRLAAAFDVSPQYWMGLNAAYLLDVAQAGEVDV